MSDLISRAVLLVEYDKHHVGPPGGARKLIESAPGVDAAPVVYGHWEERTCTKRFDFKYGCSVCHGGSDLTTRHCPHCGARLSAAGERK